MFIVIAGISNMSRLIKSTTIGPKEVFPFSMISLINNDNDIKLENRIIIA